MTSDDQHIDDDDGEMTLGPPVPSSEQEFVVAIVKGDQARVIGLYNEPEGQKLLDDNMEAVRGVLSVKNGKWHLQYDRIVENPQADDPRLRMEYAVELDIRSGKQQQFNPTPVLEIECNNVTVDNKIRTKLDPELKAKLTPFCQPMIDLIRRKRANRGEIEI